MTFDADALIAAYERAVEARGWSTNPSSGRTWVHLPNPDVLQDALDSLFEPEPESKPKSPFPVAGCHECARLEESVGRPGYYWGSVAQHMRVSHRELLPSRSPNCRAVLFQHAPHSDCNGGPA